MIECEEVYILTPKSWNPHADCFEKNEGNMLDYKGELVPRKKGVQVFLSQVGIDPGMLNDGTISLVEEKWLNESFGNLQIDEEEDPMSEHMMK